MKPILYYVHDPMCSWCWGFSQTLDELLSHLPKNIEVKRLLGGLAADSEVPMPDSMQQTIKHNWHRIEDTIPGVKFNFNFWDKNIPRRSTYPACRAVIAARLQDEEYDLLMTKAIQAAYYQEARNPSDNKILIELATEISLDTKKFSHDYYSEKVEQILDNEIMQSRELYVESYPSLVLEINHTFHTIKLNYTAYNEMLKQIKAYMKTN